jgi:hypothetical protein
VIFFFMAGLLFAPHRVRHQRAYRHWMGASPLILSVCVGLLPVNDWPLSGLGYWFVASSGGRVNKAAKGRASDTKI